MKEAIEIIKNFIIEHNIIQLIIPFSIPLILFHFIINFIKKLTYKEIIKTDYKEEEIDIINEIPDIVNNDIIMSNNQFIKF